MTASVAAGCGGSAQNELGRRPVSGRVTFDGKPLETGVIQFFTIPGAAHVVSSGASIKDGVYQLKTESGLPPGAYQVSISSSPVPTALPSDPTEAMNAAAAAKPFVDLIPPKYNLKSELKIEVPADGKAVIDFELKSK